MDARRRKLMPDENAPDEVWERWYAMRDQPEDDGPVVAVVKASRTTDLCANPKKDDRDVSSQTERIGQIALDDDTLVSDKSGQTSFDDMSADLDLDRLSVLTNPDFARFVAARNARGIFVTPAEDAAAYREQPL